MRDIVGTRDRHIGATSGGDREGNDHVGMVSEGADPLHLRSDLFSGVTRRGAEANPHRVSPSVCGIEPEHAVGGIGQATHPHHIERILVERRRRDRSQPIPPPLLREFVVVPWHGEKLVGLGAWGLGGSGAQGLRGSGAWGLRCLPGLRRGRCPAGQGS